MNEVFKDLGGVKKGAKVLICYQKIIVHLVFDVKHDGRRRACMEADSHLTEPPTDESVYSGVVSLRGLKLVIFLVELNKLKLYSTGISSAYLTAKCSERVCIIAGKRIGEQVGHILVSRKALYGLRFSGKSFNERLGSMLQQLGFVPSKVEASIWMRKNREIYEYVATYVDDLNLAMKDRLALVKQLENDPFKLKFK